MSNYKVKTKYKGPVATQYDVKRSSNPKWEKEIEIVDRILKTIPSKMSIMDLPLGTGRFLKSYEGEGHKVFGLDVSFDMLIQARSKPESKKLDPVMLVGDAERIPLKKNALDYIVSIRLVNWISTQVFNEMLKEFSRVTKSGMVLSIRVKRKTSPIDFLKYVALDLLPTDYNRTKWRRNYKKTIKKMISGLLGKKSPNSFLKGYTVHCEKRVLELFEESGFIVKEVETVENYIDYGTLELRPYLIYTLEKGANNI